MKLWQFFECSAWGLMLLIWIIIVWTVFAWEAWHKFVFIIPGLGIWLTALSLRAQMLIKLIK